MPIIGADHKAIICRLTDWDINCYGMNVIIIAWDMLSGHTRMIFILTITVTTCVALTSADDDDKYYYINNKSVTMGGNDDDIISYQ